MSDLILVLDHAGTSLELDGKSLCIKQQGHLRRRVPMALLKQVIVHGNVMASTAVWRMLCFYQIAVVWLPRRGKGEVVYLSHTLSNSYPTRASQHTLPKDKRVEIARQIISGKLESTLSFWQCVSQRVPLKPSSKMSTDKEITQCLKAVASKRALDQLMGLEGTAARSHFQGIAQLLNQEWDFNGRNRRPPKDPLNVLLSLGYSLLLSQAQQMVGAFGFDPAVGFVHQPYPGRPSLALDVIEPFRAGVDYFALSLVFDETLNPGHFTKNRGHCLMKKQGRSIFYRYWYDFRKAWPFYGGQIFDNEKQLGMLMQAHCLQMQQRLLQFAQSGKKDEHNIV
ncbi:MAG: CRISPR-associated endonuclease Cas1 [Gammaproteobacteria bacterium]|nr:CRISPR-associated endonuclease Cas1 [Gammaproteobacteria bacterium]